MAHDLNPFNPEVQDALIKGYTSQGNEKMANRHRRYATILKTGGAVTQGDLDDKQSR